MGRIYINSGEALGPLLKTLRLATATTQSGLARKAGIDRSFLSTIENGHHYPGLELLIKLAEGFGSKLAFVTPDEPDLKTIEKGE
jgi:transcriptional regulator with XRE-family HTH domain